MEFKEIKPENLKSINPFKAVGHDWMLITAGDESKVSTMTASWGGIGIMWNKNAAFCFVRPQRYTFEFLEKNEYYTLSFFKPEYKQILKICGTTSGRDTDKIKTTGLIPRFDESAPYFEQSDLVFVCKKMYGQFIDPKCFIDANIEKNYEQKDYHKFYIGEIVKCMVKE